MVQSPYKEDAVTFAVHLEHARCQTVVALSGELDYFTVPLLQAVLGDDAGRTGDIVFDIAGLRFVDTAGIGCLASVAARARASGSAARLVSPSPLAARVIRLLGLEEILGLSPEFSADRAGGAVTRRPLAAVSTPAG